jgi:hypothetical protein
MVKRYEVYEGELSGACTVSITDVQAENLKLKTENNELKTRIAAIRAALNIPHPIVEQTLDEWHKLLAKQDRDRDPAEFRNFQVTKDDP